MRVSRKPGIARIHLGSYGCVVFLSHNGICLGPLLTVYDVEFHFIALFQRLVTIYLDG